jgi:endonuclease III
VNKRDKVKKILETLDAFFPAPAVPLEHRDPFTLLVSTVLSAQCTDVRVNQVTPVLFAEADTPEKMAAMDVEKIKEIIRPCGLAPAKSKAVSGLSRIIATRYDGRVPSTFEDLESLPGVGHKTASVVMSQAFHQPAFPVDTHIHRLAARWGLSSGKSVTQTERDLKKLIPENDWGKVHLQMIYFGRAYCRALKHDAASCPICSFAALKS